MKLIKNMLAFLLTVLGLMAGSVAANAQTNSFPDATSIYTSLATPFNSALTWVIGATAVLVVIGWILKAVRRR